MPTDLVRGLKAHGTSPAKTKLFGRFPLLFGRKNFPGQPWLDGGGLGGGDASRRASRDMKKHPVDGEGTPVRRQGMIRDGLSWYFAAVNRDNRSLCRLRLRRNGVV